MDVIKIPAGDDTPKVILDANEGVFEISGKSFSEDVGGFFEPILNWLDGYARTPNKETVFNLKLVYFNSASSKLLLDILLKLEDIVDDGSKVLIKWYYADDDEDMEEAGEEYEDIVNIPFEHISYEVKLPA